MTPLFLRALAQTLGFEGEISDNPQDHGGLTKWGITQATYDGWRLTTGQPKRSVREMSPEEMRAIYFDNYWVPAACEVLPDRLAFAVFDMAVNSGVGNARRTLQRALGVKVDGVIGPKTIEAAQHASLLPFLQRRGAFIQELILKDPTQVTFLEGWINRLLSQAWRT